jgi:hypothetical protein
MKNSLEVFEIGDRVSRGGGVAKSDSLDHLDNLTFGEDVQNREDR